MKDWAKDLREKWLSNYDYWEENGKPLPFQIIKCPKCCHGNLEEIWDDTGLYHKCNRCGKEIPE